MLRLVTVFFLCVTTLPAFCQSAPKWQVGIITEVTIHQTTEEAGASDVTSYDVSVKVGDMIYVVLYTPPLGQETVKYAAGRDLLVLVGETSIRYNDLLGQPYDVPIESQRPAANPRGSESVSHGTE